MIKGCTQFLLLIFCFITQHAFGQQCGYDFYNLFILDIHRAGETRQANDIEVYLCGVDSTELQKIAPNSERKIGKKKEFPRAEDYFITLISNRVKPDASPPAYFAKVIDGGNTTFHRLFYEKSLNICSNHPHSNHPVYKDRTMIQEDGNPFSPIEIVLSEKRNKTKINYPLEQVFFRYHFKEDQTDRLQHRSSELTLEYVDVYDYRSMNKVAKLKPSKNFTFASKNRHLYLEAADVFQDNPATIKDIIITTGVINFDHQLWSDIYKEFFLFDVKNQTYYKDDALSSLPNIFINNEGKLLRTDYVIKDKYLITHHLQFNQHSWELIKTEEREIYLPQKGYSNSASEIIAEPAQCLCALESTSVLLPLVVATDSIGKYQNVEYAFILQNRCNRKIELKLMGEHPKNFQVPDAIGPLEKITVPFKTEEFITTESVMEFNKSVSISSDNDLFLNLSVKYFIAGAATEIASDKAEIRKFRSKSANGLYAYTLRTDLNLLPIEYGDELIKSGENMGTWYSFNPDGTVRLNEIISKRFFFQIMNKDINPDAFYPEIRKNKEWIKPEFARTDKGYMFFCDDQTDSIRLIAKQLKADFAYHFDESTNSSGGSFYLIAENEEYLLQGQIKIPVKYFDDFYLISWDYAKTTREGNNFNYRNHIEKLIKPFPGVRFNEFPLISEQYIIDFSQVSKNVKLAVLKNLSEDEYIDAVSIQIQLFDQDPTFAQKTISIQYNNNVIPSQNLEILKQNGFGNIQVANGSTHVYHATFQSKLLDRSFYQILNQLSREKEMVIVTPSLMYKTELEFDPGNLPRD